VITKQTGFVFALLAVGAATLAFALHYTFNKKQPPTPVN
jgi:hypothetical protein